MTLTNLLIICWNILFVSWHSSPYLLLTLLYLHLCLYQVIEKLLYLLVMQLLPLYEFIMLFIWHVHKGHQHVTHICLPLPIFALF